MPALVAILWGGFAAILEGLVGRVLVYLGISYFTYQGVDILFDGIHAAAMATLGQVANQFVGIIGMMKIEESLNVLLSATVAKYTLNGLTGGKFTKVGFKS